MPKILVDNSKEIQERTYAIKTCPICGSIIEISEHEAMNTPNNKDGFMEFECPCGTKLPIYKYFGGKKYSDKDYVECLNYFKKTVDDVLWNDLKECRMGYGEYYFNLHHTELLVSPIRVSINVYINNYEHGNWEKCISRNEFYKKFNFSLAMLSNDLEQCALYSQALSDYIIFDFDKIRKQGTDLRLQSIDKDELIAYFRNADVCLTDEDMIMITSQKFEFV